MEGIEETIEGQEAKQHQENGGELSAEQLAKFSADYGAPAKSEEKKEPENKAATTEANTETDETDEEEAFVLFPEEKEEDGAGADADKDKDKQPSKRDYSKFKEVLELDEDIDSDDSLLEKIKGITSKAKAQELINTANERFVEDKEVQAWKSWLDADDDELVKQTFILGKGYTEEDAIEKVAELKDTDPKEYRAILNSTRNQLKALIGQKADKIRAEVEEAATTLKNISPKEVDTKVLKGASDSVSKISEFAGLKLGIGDKNREEHVKPVKSLIESGEILKRLKSDPDLLAKVAYFVHYEKQISGAVQNRFYPKKKFVDSLDNAPHSSGKAVPRATIKEIKTGEFDPKGFN